MNFPIELENCVAIEALHSTKLCEESATTSTSLESRNASEAEPSTNLLPGASEDDKERQKIIGIFQEESCKSEEWNRKYIHSTMFLLGYGAYGSVFQVTTRLYPSKMKISQERHVYHPEFLMAYASQRKMKVEYQGKLKDKNRSERLFDTVAIKYELLEQSQLEDGATRFYLFLRREFLVLDTLWRRFSRLLVGFPAVFDFGYIGDKLQYGVSPKYKNIFTYLNINGEEVKFLADTNNRNLQGVTKISYMAMEMLGPSIDDYKTYFAPWYTASLKVRPFFQVRTAFRIADQVLSRLYILHRAGFVHHDLKPDNLVVGIGRALNTIYLIDFGFAKQISDNPVSEWMGSRKFIAIDTYNNAKANFAQDIESWFYVTMSLLHDSLPWSDEVILPMLHQEQEDGAKWALVNAIKKTWWGEYSASQTLRSMIEAIQATHRREVPDIQSIIQQLHKKTRELRAHMRQISDAKTLQNEVVNPQSTACKGYMSIRKVMLQIFDLPNIAANPMLGDQEFRTYQEARKEKGLAPFRWDPGNFEWEWDRNHERMISSTNPEEDGPNPMEESDLGEKMDSPVVADGESCDSSELMESGPSARHNTARLRRQIRRIACGLEAVDARRLRMRALDAPTTVAAGVRQKPDEVSYVYDPESNTLVPKAQSHRRRGALLRLETAGSDGKASDGGEQLWQLTNPSCLQ